MAPHLCKGNFQGQEGRGGCFHCSSTYEKPLFFLLGEGMQYLPRLYKCLELCVPQVNEHHFHCNWKSPGPQSGLVWGIWLVGYFSFHYNFALDPPAFLLLTLRGKWTLPSFRTHACLEPDHLCCACFDLGPWPLNSYKGLGKRTQYLLEL